jgi:hypothetical protein
VSVEEQQVAQELVQLWQQKPARRLDCQTQAEEEALLEQ